MPANAETQSWVTKTVWQRIPARWARNSKLPTTITDRQTTNVDNWRCQLFVYNCSSGTAELFCEDIDT